MLKLSKRGVSVIAPLLTRDLIYDRRRQGLHGCIIGTLEPKETGIVR